MQAFCVIYFTLLLVSTFNWEILYFSQPKLSTKNYVKNTPKKHPKSYSQNRSFFYLKRERISPTFRASFLISKDSVESNQSISNRWSKWNHYEHLSNRLAYLGWICVPQP